MEIRKEEELIMEYDKVEKTIARRSATIYLPVSSVMAFLFLWAASLSGNYAPAARIGGTVWVGLLSLIISMPIITAWVKRQVVR
jgi:hypothetical protein